MCRAVWVVVVAPDLDTCKALRRALGPDTQVVLMTTDVADPVIRSTTADALVVEGSMPGARELVDDLAQSEIAILWVGAESPSNAHHASEQKDDLESALTKALLARRA